jgi:folate-dependent phosphoribosylglycinamide formyltransferase PurN
MNFYKEHKIVIITSNQLRHKFYCREIAKKMQIAGIVAEGKSNAVTDFSNYNEEDQAIINKHFRGRDQVEESLMGKNINFPEADLLNINSGEINNRNVTDWIIEKKPDYILLYGSGIIKEPLLSDFENKIINLHLGLSPYYKGSGTNFWPLVYNEPECVGATIHLAIRKVDAGSILHQVRPDTDVTDRAHELGTKTIIKAVDIIPEVIKSYSEGNIQPVRQDLASGKVFMNKDFNADAVKTMWANFENGMMENYISDFETRLSKFPIIEGLQ